VGFGFELRVLHLQNRPSTTWATPLVHFALIILEMGPVNYLPGLASNYDPPGISLPSSYDYRRESPALGYFKGFVCLFCGTGAWNQGLHFEPLHQPFLWQVFFKIGSHGTICPGWLQTMILLISASGVIKFTGMSHQRPAYFKFFKELPIPSLIMAV
jgi:hypothetical protein